MNNIYDADLDHCDANYVSLSPLSFLGRVARVYPDHPIVDITLDHPIYSAYYDIEEVKQVPAIGRAMYPAECYGCVPYVKGIYDEDGRLVVIINFNTDLGDAWEWAEDPRYPLELSLIPI